MICHFVGYDLDLWGRWQLTLVISALQLRHNEQDGVWNHQPHDCLLNRLFKRRSKKTSQLRVTGLCAGTSPGTGEFPTQMAIHAENVSIWWRHHGLSRILGWYYSGRLSSCPLCKFLSTIWWRHRKKGIKWIWRMSTGAIKINHMTLLLIL